MGTIIFQAEMAMIHSMQMPVMMNSTAVTEMILCSAVTATIPSTAMQAMIIWKPGTELTRFTAALETIRLSAVKASTICMVRMATIPSMAEMV